jgi:LysR family transcriptional regulator, transcriptional activator of nhaA
MNLTRLNFHHLFYFWRVARLGHLTQAAQELHLAQSALSAQIRQLEGRLGEPLFTRRGRRLVLTDTGHLVLSYAEEIFGLGQEMLGRLQGQTGGFTRLRVGSVATLSRNYLENWIRPVLSDPAVVLALESGPLDWLLERLRRHQLNVVLANEAVPVDPDRPLHCRLLGSQAVCLVVQAGAWPGGLLDIPGGLQGREMALPGPRHALRAQFDALCGAAGIVPRLRAEVDDMAMLRLIARDSGWLTLLPEVVVQDELRTRHLVIAGHSAQLREHFYAITAPHRSPVPVLARLLATASPEGSGPRSLAVANGGGAPAS